MLRNRFKGVAGVWVVGTEKHQDLGRTHGRLASPNYRPTALELSAACQRMVETSRRQSVARTPASGMSRAP